MIWGEASGAVVKEADRIKRMGERQGWKEGGKELEGGERIDGKAGKHRKAEDRGENRKMEGRRRAGLGGKMSNGEGKKDDVWGRGEERGPGEKRRGRKLGSGETHAIFCPTTSSGAGLQSPQLPGQCYHRGADSWARPSQAASAAPAPHA